MRWCECSVALPNFEGRGEKRKRGEKRNVGGTVIMLVGSVRSVLLGVGEKVELSAVDSECGCEEERGLRDYWRGEEKVPG